MSSCAILLPDIDLTDDRWIALSPTRWWADHQRYRWQQCWSAHFIHHPFHHQPLSIHEPTKLMSSPCYSPVSDMPPCLWDTMAPRRHHINVAIVDKYVCAKAATVKKRWRHFCLQMWAILSTFWHPCRLGISQNEVDFYIVLKIGPS